MTKGFGEGLRTPNHTESFWAVLKRTANFDNGVNLSSVEGVKIFYARIGGRILLGINVLI
jgi:hypothetical protein